MYVAVFETISSLKHVEGSREEFIKEDISILEHTETVSLTAARTGLIMLVSGYEDCVVV